MASDAARFGLPEVTRGLAAAAGGLLRLPRRIPYHLAMEAALTGDRIPAPQLHRAGLINRLVPPGHALPAATELARRISQNAPLALAATKQVIVQSAGWPAAEQFARQNQITAPYSPRRTPSKAQPPSPRNAPQSGEASEAGETTGLPGSGFIQRRAHRSGTAADCAVRP